MNSAIQDAMAIVQRFECGRSGCPCHASARKGHGLTHAVWRKDTDPSLSVSVHDGTLLVYDFGGDGQRVTVAQLVEMGLWHQPTGFPRMRIARMPHGAKDVADLLQQGRDAEYEAMIAEAQDAVGWMVDNPPEEHSSNFGLLGRTLAELDEVHREVYCRRLADKLGVPPETVAETLADYLGTRADAIERHVGMEIPSA